MTFLRRDIKQSDEAMTSELRRLIHGDETQPKLLSQNRPRPLPIKGNMVAYLLSNHSRRLMSKFSFSNQGLEAMRNALRKKGVVGV